jgi:hypothetical protein
VQSFIKKEAHFFKDYNSKRELFELMTENLIQNELHLNNLKQKYQDLHLKYQECKNEKNQTCENIYSDLIQQLKSKEMINNKQQQQHKKSLSIEKQAQQVNTSIKSNANEKNWFNALENELNHNLPLEKNELNNLNATLKGLESQVDYQTSVYWTILNTVFTLGGMLGAFTSKYFMDYFGRKRSFLIHNLFSIIGGLLALLSPYIHSPVALLACRFLFGIQSGMTCAISPSFINVTLLIILLDILYAMANSMAFFKLCPRLN